MSPNVMDRFNAAMLLIFEHAGTHVDAPHHLVSVGKPTIDDTVLSQWMGDCCVIRMNGMDPGGLVEVADIKQWEKEHCELAQGDMVIFDFGWPNGWSTKYFNSGKFKQNPGLSEEAAKYLVSKGVKLIGCDVPAIDSYRDEKNSAHKVILENKIPLLENLANLELLPSRGAFIIALPLRIKSGSGSPVRAIAFVPKR